jgi:type I restriction enzyme R subunit
MADYNENPFETELCEHLAGHGWLHSLDDTGYDRERALFSSDVLGWLADTQPEQLAKVVKPGGTDKDRRTTEAALLDRLVKVLELPLDAGGGTLNILRNGFRHISARFEMCQFRPPTNLNQTTLEHYGKVRVRVMRQVHYSTSQPQRSIDLVLFVNGLPVATAELKTDFTQSVEDAKTQYRTTRLPVDPTTKKVEPLFGFGNRALVHFAVSNDEVWMTTCLAGKGTYFLPFNRGCEGAAGNPANPRGSKTAYLWERVWDRDTWLHIIGKFLHTERTESIDPITGQKTKSTNILFPRYHQWEAVAELVETARRERVGNRYLVEHSAGSGKTHSICWTAHQLATLHDEHNDKVFDTVIVVTDRTVLDDQLQEAIRQVDTTTGVVETITIQEATKAGLKSKSEQLAKALTDRRLIVVVTIQTFPFAMEVIRKTKGLKHRRFAVIADEAHSSQTGGAASKLKDVLTSDELKDLEEGGDIDTEALLAAEVEARADSKNISYFAFTATPKPKTLELFGRRQDGGLPRAFHVYTMQQAIEEGFILDVLRNYTPYQTAFTIAEKVAGAADKIVDQSRATTGLMRWVKLHPTNISQKVQIIVEHFRVNVEPLLDGYAKAMVVTDSRKAAVRYKLAMDRYIAKQGYAEVTSLVAFSGDVTDEESGPDPFNEGNMNPGLRGRDLRSAFATNDYRVMIVANKFQTGFDQPLLVAMYVDKRLDGVAAVQTLSRLNRIYPKVGKDTTYVVDFVNDPEAILAAFKPYYGEAWLAAETDPNLVHDLRAKLDTAAIYTTREIDRLAEAWVKRKGNNALTAAITPARDRFQQRYLKALAAGDKVEIAALDLFRKDVSTFVRLYDFLSQIINYGDTDLEKRALFFRLLERRIRPEQLDQPVDLSEVELRHVHQHAGQTLQLKLDPDDSPGLKGISAAGSKPKGDPKLTTLAQIIERLNQLFSDEGFTEAQTTSWVESLVAALVANDALMAQARTNSKAQFLDSPDLRDEVVGAFLTNQAAHSRMAELFSADGKVQEELVRGLGELLYERAKKA